MRLSLVLLLLLSAVSASSQPAREDNCGLQISLLTCTPGEELYSTFGHSALRVTDSANKRDIIFNYGTFDFQDPGFYEKFVKGKLLYFVSVDSLNRFLYEYEYFQRGVTEQVLNLDCGEKQRFLSALLENAKEENKYYLYDFTYDNCTTRLRDMLEKAIGQQLQVKNILPSERTTFRHLIHEYLDRGGQYWSKLGIDILLGTPLDRKITNREAMFLPDYLFKAFDSASIRQSALVTEKNELLPAAGPKKTIPFFTPFVVLGFVFLLIVALTFFKFPAGKIFLKAFDVFFFSICGLLGLLIIFMWFGTNHLMCRNNFNLLWALPTHLIAGLFLFTSRNWVNLYFRFIFFYTIVLLAAWFLLPQQFNLALLPVIGIILVRSYAIGKKANDE